MIAQIPNPPLASDFSIYSFAQSHSVVDVVGYYAPAVATATECVETAQQPVTLPAGSGSYFPAPTCPTGYTSTATNCELGSYDMHIVAMRNGNCAVQNSSGTSATFWVSRTCCRVPGR